MRPIILEPSLTRPWGSRKVTPVPDASIGYAFGSPQSSWVTFDATRGIFALAIAAETSAWPAVPWSFTVAMTPAWSILRTQDTAWSVLAPSSQVVTCTQEPLAPPRLLNAFAATSSAVAWSFSERTGDSNTVIRPILSGGFEVSQGPSSHRPMAFLSIFSLETVLFEPLSPPLLLLSSLPPQAAATSASATISATRPRRFDIRLAPRGRTDRYKLRAKLARATAGR